MAAILEESLQAEEAFAKIMDKLSLKAATFTYKGYTLWSFHNYDQIIRTIANAIQTLKLSFMHKADLSKSLAKSIKEDILDNLKEVIKVQNYEGKNAITDGKKLEKDFKKISENLEKVFKQNNWKFWLNF